MSLSHRLRSLRAGPHGIQDRASLHRHLQIALEIELSTLPPYLCALYSIRDGANVEVAGLIRSVLMEEMLHLTLAANVLNAVGGTPRLSGPGVVPAYPTTLPDSNGAFVVNLQKFSPAALATFLDIERPAPAGAPPQADGYATLGQFYEAIESALKRLSREGLRFDHAPSRQVEPADYYNGHGNIVVVRSLEDALRALHEIRHQGEGIHHGILESQEPLDRLGYDLAHFFRFTEISAGRRFRAGDTPAGGPTGPLLPVDWNAVQDMITNPRAGWFAPGDPVRRRLDDCNAVFYRLLDALEGGFRGRKQSLRAGIPLMLELKQRATELMNLPSGIAGTMLGPTFEHPGAEA